MLAEAEKEAQRQGLANTVFHQSDSESLPFADKLFDIVTCKLALHYFPNPNRAVGEMKRVAKSGGRLILIDRVAAEDRQTREFHNRIEKLRTPSKVRVYAPSEIRVLLEGEGLEVNSVHHYEQYQDVDEWLLTTGAPEDSQKLARQLILDSLEEDAAGLKLFCENGRLMMTHQTAIFVAQHR